MAQKKYSVICNDNAGAAPRTLFNLIGSSVVRPRIYEMDFGSTPVAPVDQASTFLLSRSSAVGTAGSNPTPQPLDNQEVAAVSTVGIAHTAEPTYAATGLWQVPLNHRASWRWVAAPDSEFICTATASNGIGLSRTSSTATYGATGTVLFFE